MNFNMTVKCTLSNINIPYCLLWLYLIPIHTILYYHQPEFMQPILKDKVISEIVLQNLKSYFPVKNKNVKKLLSFFQYQR